MSESPISHMQNVFKHVHKCKATHLETVQIVEPLDGATMWGGDVEVFRLDGHPEANRGYAWMYEKEKGAAIIAVLELPPVVSAKTAVQAAIKAQGK